MEFFDSTKTSLAKIGYYGNSECSTHVVELNEGERIVGFSAYRDGNGKYCDFQFILAS